MNNSFFNPNIGTSFYTADVQSDTMEGIFRRVPNMRVTVYATFPGSNEWRDKAFMGIIEGAGRDHIVLSNPQNGVWTVIPNIYIDYVEFDESIQNYIRNS